MRSTFLVCALSLCGIAPAQLIVGNDQAGTATIYEINVATGVATPLYSSTDSSAKPWGMAADNANSILYWNSGSTLYSASFASLLAGTASPASVTMTLGAVDINFVGLGFNAATGKLIATRNIGSEAVYEIDPLTGVATEGVGYNVNLDFGGLEFDNATGKLYGTSDSGVRGLHEINPVDGSTVFKANYPVNETDIDGLAVHNGVAYLVTDGPNTDQANFYMFDIASGTEIGTLASPFLRGGTFAAATYAPGLVPEPGTILALGAGLAAIARRRKAR